MDARDTERELRQERRQKENLEKKVGVSGALFEWITI